MIEWKWIYKPNQTDDYFKVATNDDGITIDIRNMGNVVFFKLTGKALKAFKAVIAAVDVNVSDG